MKNNESMEMYLETILILENEHGHAHTTEIAKRLGVKKPSVTKAMNDLKNKGFIEKESYGTITLTEKGTELSQKIYENHQLIALFLKHSLGLCFDEATSNACKLEHVISDTMVDAIRGYLKRNRIKFPI